MTRHLALTDCSYVTLQRLKPRRSARQRLGGYKRSYVPRIRVNEPTYGQLNIECYKVSCSLTFKDVLRWYADHVQLHTPSGTSITFRRTLAPLRPLFLRHNGCGMPPELIIDDMHALCCCRLAASVAHPALSHKALCGS